MRRRLAPEVWVLAVVLLAAIASLNLTRDGRGPTARLTADAWYYHCYTVSLVNDRDLDFTNEYQITGNWYGFGPTSTGRLGNPFGIGAPIFAIPFYLVGSLVAVASGGTSNGFGTAQVRAVVLAAPVFTLGAVFFAWRLCRRRLPRRAAALAGPIAAVLAGPALYYAVRQPGYAHPAAALFGAWLVDAWDASFTDAPRRLGTWLGLGLLLGAAALARPQLASWGVLYVVAAVDDVRRGGLRPAVVGRWLAAAAAAVVAFLPQIAAWKILYGAALAVPQGPGFMVWAAPAWSEVLFAARNGLFAWAPVYALAAVGLAAAVPRAPRLAGGLLVGVALQVWANGAVWDWWGGGAYGGRRFDSCLVAFAYGLAFLLSTPRWTRWLAAAVTTIGVAGNLAFAYSSHIMNLENHDGVPPAEVLTRRLPPGLGAATGALSWVTTLPARAAFAWRHGAPLGAYDRVVGVHLLSDFFPGVLKRPVKNTELVTLAGDEPFLVGFEPARPGARLRSGTATILVSLNRRHGPIRATLAAPAPIGLRWDGRPVAATPGPDGVTALLDPIERGVHDLAVEAPAGTVVRSLKLEVPPGVPP
jgi:hypothetical protein